MGILSIITPTILLTSTGIVNIFSALSAWVIGVFILARSPRSSMHIAAFSTAFFLGFWAMASTLADVMHTPAGALFWARTAIIGPFGFVASFAVLSLHFPGPSQRIERWKLALILGPALAVLPLVPTAWNLASISLEDWGTDFTPGPLYTYGLPYVIGCVLFGVVNLLMKRRHERDQEKRDQILLVTVAIGIVFLILILTNGILPVFFNFTQAAVVGPASGLLFTGVMCYAIYAKGALDIRVLATEFLSYILVFLIAIQMLTSETAGEFAKNMLFFALLVPTAWQLTQSVKEEVRRREELQAMTVQLSAANDRLRELDELKTEFVSIAAHQLRTPISIMKGYLALLMEDAYGPLTDSMREKAGHMFQMNERLVLMVNNMLNVTRMERNVIEFTLERGDAMGVARDCVREMQMKARQKGLEAHLDDVGHEVMAFFDKEKLHEVLSNLLDNAVKYSLSGTVSCGLKPWRDGKQVLIWVRDQGPGIPEGQTGNLFKKFSRLDTRKGSSEAGTGLGLYVCKHFTEGMNGAIWVDRSAEGKGTTFALTLPTEPAVRCEPPERTPVTPE